MIRPEEIAFAVRHRADDVARLLLSGKKNSGLDLSTVAQQIEGWRQAREKWPTLSECDEAWYPPRLNREQSSSEATARYKAALFVQKGDRVADLTGGMGIDSLFAAKAGAVVNYVEHDESLCEGMRHNLNVLSIDGGNVHCGDSIEWIAKEEELYDTIYIDPARRDAHGGKVSAFEDCTPNLLEHLGMLLQHCKQLIVKASPMIDLATARRQLGSSLCETHIIAVKNECKEVLFVCQQQSNIESILCTNIDETRHPEAAIGHAFPFRLGEETAAEAVFCPTIERYLYEPHAALMKGGPFNLLCQRYHVRKLARNTNLYTSSELIDDFPGRAFEVLHPVLLNAKSVHGVIPNGKVHVISRNYPVSAEVLQKQLNLKEGGELFIIATTIGTQKTGLLCKRER